MTDADLVCKKLGQIEAFVGELRQHARPDDLETDVVMQRFVIHTLQTAIQAGIDVASHIISADRLREPTDQGGHFVRLAQAGWVPAKQAQTLSAMVGFRNTVVHGYAEVDLDVVRSVLKEHLDDLIDFTVAIRRRLDYDQPT